MPGAGINARTVQPVLAALLPLGVRAVHLSGGGWVDGAAGRHRPEGMGMGLPICRSIIEFHKGRLWVESNPGGGSVFRFTLPVED